MGKVIHHQILSGDTGEGAGGHFLGCAAVFSPRGDRVCIKNDKLAAFQALRCFVAIIHYALLVVSEYLFCTVQ